MSKMTDKLDVSPTRGNLLRLQDKLKQLKQGHDLLDRNQQVMIQELFDRIDAAKDITNEARKRFREGYRAIHEARMDIGLDRLRWISLAPSVQISASVKTRSIMDIEAALVDMDIETLPIPYGPGDTDVSLDIAHQKWLRIADILDELVEKTVTVWRLAMVLRRTQRQVNALEKIIIPRYQATIKYISDQLEEKEREEIVHAKKVKQLLREGDQDKF
jgi:V/A-type H+-transporting ATPase subunit D